MIRLVVTLLTLAGTMAAQTPGRYADVNGLHLYYELHGPADAKAPPLILLHGGVGGIMMFGPNLPVLAAGRQVIAVELQGHGHTADIDRPLRFELMADDIAALAAQLKIAQVDVMGYSMGGGVALQVAIRHPQLVRRLVVVCEPIKHSGFFPEVQAAFEHMGPEAGAAMKQSPLATMYPNVNWATLFTKIGDMARQNYDWSADVAKITSPTMLIFADADAVTPAHIMEMWGLLGGGKRDAGLDGSGRPPGRLAIVPGTTHYDILNTDAVARLVIPFLEKP
ncbi:MAG TPA: alpha/beta hydrolase [Gemmatimonadales bacterium]|nr:alpha/beta hydrolase [Gemmatimonadales bacterium]